MPLNLNKAINMIYARKNKNECGDYVDTAAARWSVMFAANPYNPARWQQFDSEEAALEALGLTFDPPSPLQASDFAEATPRQDAETSPLPVPEAEG